MAVYRPETASETNHQEINSSDPAAAPFRDQIASMDMASTFATWNGGLEEVERLGAEVLDGEGVCKYRLSVDSAKASAAKGDSLPEGMPDTVYYDLFLTRDDLMHRVEVELGGVTAEMNASQWNEPVDIEVPRG